MATLVLVGGETASRVRARFAREKGDRQRRGKEKTLGLPGVHGEGLGGQGSNQEGAPWLACSPRRRAACLASGRRRPCPWWAGPASGQAGSGKWAGAGLVGLEPGAVPLFFFFSCYFL